MKKSVLIVFFAALLTFVFNGLILPDAVAKADSKSAEEKKVTICHYPPGNPENMQTLSVAESAVPAHLAHGDTMGECVDAEGDGADEGVTAPGCVCPPGVDECVCPDGSAGVTGGASSGAAGSQREVHGD